ncbi:TPA: hypothetical protein N0F65_001808 [Lagenidium giganteum]|uniref:FAD-binding FR-type domain-containing protein n=1 Tax=Lagenidium giganteum TaxID=4803 RepID=A0AAV2Z1N7_9STRA|nr:TPA: hypothetical protein N0F65_001808 [Lagenidium giganteum]
MAYEQSPVMSPGGGTRSPNEDKFFTLSGGKQSSIVATPFVYGTPMGKNFKRWPFVIVFICAFIVMASYIFHELPEYRIHLRYSMYEWFGARIQDLEWVGGHREVVDFLFLFVAIGLPTLIGGCAIAAGDALPPVPKGVHRTVMRFLKRKLTTGRVNTTYAEGMALLVFLGMNSIWFASVFSRKMAALESTGALDNGSTFLSIGYAFGFNAVFCFALLILPATRNCFWFISVGVDYSHSIKYHRWIGFFTIFLVVAHAFPYYREWISKGVFIQSSMPCLKCDYGKEGRKRLQNFMGQVALLCCLIMLITSLNPVRRRFYELFYYCHHLFIIVLITSCMHFSSFVIYMYPGICLYMMHRILSNTQSRVACEVVDLEAIPGEVTRIVFRRSPGKAGHYHAGQFVYLRIPLLSRTQWHPFSISSSPIEYEDTFTVHVKAVGNWTKSLYAVAIQAREERKLPLVYVDGFYGKMSDDFQHYPALVFIAGGIGATPVISIVGKVLDCMRNNDPHLIYTQVYFHWTSREIGIFHEFEPLLDAIEQFDPDHNKIKVRLCFTGDQHLGGVDIPNGITLKPMDDTSSVPTRPFFQASRSVTRQLLLFFVTFTASFACVFWMRWGYPLLGPDRVNQNVWPLQRLMELVVMLAGAALGWVVAMSETKPRLMSRMEKNNMMPGSAYGSPHSDEESERSSQYSHTLSFDGQEVQFGHPVSRTRLNVKELLADVVKEQSNNFAINITGIGTWVSGPMGLIHAVETEAGKFAGIFDVHYEEFEM